MTCTSDQKTNPHISALDKIYMPLPLGVMCEYPSTEKYGFWEQISSCLNFLYLL